ncbi:hypothetical protein BCR42DRAFT_486605 [Absidia repens]|uniref:Uncharacterized protein n=1 Tax=Absidia repens TaxID=90262 RepID=A0A1X2IYE7_9FUNG|nr:hypothetical protein BCR42DRAFT_486605 [Absidia repens]
MTTYTSVDSLDFIKVMETQIAKCQQSNILDDVRTIEYLGLLQENKEKYRELCNQTDYFQKQILLMKRENACLIKTQQRLETQIYAQDQELQSTAKQVMTLTRRNKELESRLDTECQHYEADRLVWYQTEMELNSAIKKCSLQNSQPRRTRSATASNIFYAPNKGNSESFCYHPSLPSSSYNRPSSDGVQRSQEFNLSKIQAQERLLKSLTSELEKQKIAHLASIHEQDEQLTSITAELQSIKELNHTLMEDNEGYQMLLTEKTMSGEFLKKVEQEENMSLATEMKRTSFVNDPVKIQELTDENKTLKESNKALSLYMNKILLKIVGNHDLVDVLNIDIEAESEKEKCPLVSAPNPPSPMQQQHRARRSTISTCRNSNNQEKGWTKALKRMTVMGWSAGKPSALNYNREDITTTATLE